MHVIYWLLIFIYLITFNLNCCCGLERLPRIWKVWCSSPCTSGDCPRAKRLETRANGTMYHLYTVIPAAYNSLYTTFVHTVKQGYFYCIVMHIMETSPYLLLKQFQPAHYTCINPFASALRRAHAKNVYMYRKYASFVVFIRQSKHWTSQCIGRIQTLWRTSSKRSKHRFLISFS